MEEIVRLDKREEFRMRRRKKKMQFLLILCVVLLVVLIIMLIIAKQMGTMKSYQVTSEVELPSGLADYAFGEDMLFLCSNDGSKAISENGETKWEISYHLDYPVIEYCEDVAAVADIGGTTVYIVAANGIPYNYRVVYPIVKHAVAKQGVTAVLLNNGAEDYIQLYDINGTLRVDINTKTKTDGIPVDIALSPDGKKLVTLYMTFEGSEMVGKVTFYNAGEVGKNYNGNIVGQKTFENNKLVYDIGFLNDETVYVLYEDGFCIYRMHEVPELILEQITENEVLDVAVTENGMDMVEKTPAGTKHLFYYPTDKGIFSRERVWSHLPEYETMYATEDEVVFLGMQSVTVYRANHSLKYEGNFKSSPEAVFPLGGNRYFLLEPGSVRVIKLTKKKQEEGE